MAHIITTKLLSNTFLKMEPSDPKYNKKKEKGPLATICLLGRIQCKFLNILLVITRVLLVIMIIAISMQYGDKEQVTVIDEPKPVTPEPEPVTPEPEPVTPEPEPVMPEPEPVTPCQQILTPPNKRLHEFHPGCNTDGKSRHPDCVAAMSRYCNNIQFSCNRPVHAITAVSQEHANGWIVFGCIESTYAGPVPMSTIHHLHGGCRHGNSQSMDCLAATHRFCTPGHAGLTQEVAAPDSLWVTCFKASLEQMVSIGELQAMHYPCSMGTSNSDDCFAAASRWCISRGHNGGITQEATGNHIHVVCFKSLHDASAFV